MKKNLAALFLSGHIVLLTLANVPQLEKSFADYGGRLIQSYVRSLTLVQRWTMFEDYVPYHHLNVRIEAEGDGGVMRNFGPILPNLDFFDDSMSIRSIAFFHRLDEWSFRRKRIFRRYQKRLCSAIRKQGFEAKSVSLVFEVDRFIPGQVSSDQFELTPTIDRKKKYLCRNF